MKDLHIEINEHIYLNWMMYSRTNKMNIFLHLLQVIENWCFLNFGPGVC